MRSTLGNVRFNLIQTTSTLIRRWPRHIAKKVTSGRRWHFMKKHRRQRISPAPGLPSLTRGWADNRRRSASSMSSWKKREHSTWLRKGSPPFMSRWAKKTKLFAGLERAFNEHSANLYTFAFHPEFRALRSDSRFPGLLRRIGIDFAKVLNRQKNP